MIAIGLANKDFLNDEERHHQLGEMILDLQLHLFAARQEYLKLHHAYSALLQRNTALEQQLAHALVDTKPES